MCKARPCQVEKIWRKINVQGSALPGKKNNVQGSALRRGGERWLK